MIWSRINNKQIVARLAHGGRACPETLLGHVNPLPYGDFQREDAR